MLRSAQYKSDVYHPSFNHTATWLIAGVSSWDDMAGDWIKVEKTTARKIEVVKLGRKLQINPDHAFGLCVRFWMWCDDQLLDQFMEGLTLSDVDAIIGYDGFSAALVDVGWLNDSQGILSIPHFDRHLSKGAKTRAQSMNRMQKQRGKPPPENPLRSKRNKSVTDS